MNSFFKALTIFGVLLLLVEGSMATKCYSCVSKSLEGDQVALGLAVSLGFNGLKLNSAQFTASCDSSTTLGPTLLVDCSSPCQEVSISSNIIAGGQTAYLRGCQVDITGSNSGKAVSCESGSLSEGGVNIALQHALCTTDGCNKDSSAAGLSTTCAPDNGQTSCHMCVSDVGTTCSNPTVCKSRYCLRYSDTVPHVAQLCLPINPFGQDTCESQNVGGVGFKTCYCSSNFCSDSNPLSTTISPPVTRGGRKIYGSSILLFIALFGLGFSALRNN